jgi:hypothetical protein
MKGRPWSVEEEMKLRTLVESKISLEDIASELNKTSDAILKKCLRLGLEVVGSRSLKTTTSFPMPKDLLSV